MLNTRKSFASPLCINSRTQWTHSQLFCDDPQELDPNEDYPGAAADHRTVQPEEEVGKLKEHTDHTTGLKYELFLPNTELADPSALHP
eukprot:2074065-Pyramimonas_sp.AAC.1